MPQNFAQYGGGGGMRRAARPVQGEDEEQAGQLAVQPTRTFAEMQRAGQARPAPPAQAGGGFQSLGVQRENVRAPEGELLEPIGHGGLPPAQSPPNAGGGTGSPPPDFRDPNTPAQTGGGGGTQTGSGPGQRQPWRPGQNPFEMPTGGAAGTNVLSHLWGQYDGAPGANTFGGAWSPTAAPNAHQPGQYSGPGYQPVAAPTAGKVGTFAGGGSALRPGIERALAASLGQPSAYGAPEVQRSFNTLSGEIDDEFALEQQRLSETLAARGLGSIDDGTIGLGRLSDLNIGKRDAKTRLAESLLDKQATTFGADRSRAIAQAMGYDQDTFTEGLATHNTNASGVGQNFQQELARAAFEGDQNATSVLQALGIAGFNRESGQQGFNNAMQGAQFNAGQRQQGFNNDATTFGMNESAGQRSTDNRQRALETYLGAGRQAFEQDLATQQANNAMDSQFTQYLLSLFGGLN